MSQTLSPSAQRSYGVDRVCRVWRVSRSTFYAWRSRRAAEERGDLPARRKPGPLGPCTDEELAGHIRRLLAASPWVGEGHRKVWARLRYEGLRTSRRRVLRIMREEGLLAPQRVGRRHGPKAHDGTIIPDHPDEMWGTDATSVLTGEGQATVFAVLDHCTAECLGIHAARRGTRFEALDPLRQAVRRRFLAFDEDVVDGELALRHDHGSQFTSHTYQDEVRFLGLRSSPAYVGEPEGNGCIERFFRTLKEQLLWIHRFDTVEELNRALRSFMERYNREWLIERHGWISPSEQRERLVAEKAAA